ncbi:MAG: hypothetical protein Q9169_003605 [Polycauliona sp. 2 TL-2023]
MEGILKTLSQETLYKILHQVDAVSLEGWAYGNRCRLQALIPLVLNALPSLSCALDILGILCMIYDSPPNPASQALIRSVTAQEKSFREGVLEAEPLLVESLLRQSVETDHGFHRYSAACVNLLSSPPGIAIPASITPFLVKLLRNASQSPSADTIRPVYKVLSGSGPHMLDALPSDVVVRMQDQCREMLEKFKFDMEGNCANLFCLAILALISGGNISSPVRDQEDFAPSPPTTASSSNVEPGASHCEARRFFVGKRGSKTLGLAVCKMILAFSKSCKLSTPVIVETLQISGVILGAINDTDRATWMGRNHTKINKLVEKVTSYTDSPEVLSTALRSIVTLFGDHPLPEALSPACRVSLPTASTLPCGVGVKLLLVLDESSVQECLLSLLQTADGSIGKNDHFRETEAALLLVKSFALSIASSASLRHKILYLLSTNALADPLRRFLTRNNALSNRGSDDHKHRCPHSYAERQITLRRKICLMLLKTSVFSQQDTLSLDPSTALALLDTIANTERVYSACQFPTDVIHSRPTALVSLFETGSTPCSSAESDLWRHRIKNQLVQNAEYQYQGVVRAMEGICHDLERRCNEVEAPLRDEQAKSSKLRAELEESRLRIAKLSFHTHEQSLVLEGVEGEKSELLARVADLEHGRNELFGRAEGLRQELGKVIEEGEDTDRNRMKEIRELELVQAAVMAEKDEILEAQDRKDKDSKARIDQLEGEMVDLRANVSLHQDNVGRLESTVAEQQIKLCSATTLVGEKQDTTDRLEDQLDRSRKERSDLQTEVTRLSDAARELRAELEGRAATVDNQLAELNALRRQHEVDSAAQVHELAQIKQSSTERAEELQQLLNKQSDDAALTIQRRDSRVSQLEDELGKLRSDLEDRDNELEEAQALNEQVVAFWTKQRRRNPVEPDARHKPTPAGIARPKRPSVRISKESPEHKRSRTNKHVTCSPLSRNTSRVSDETGALASCNKAKPMRRPLADVDAGLQTRLNISPVRSSSSKGIWKQWVDENDAGENTQQAEGSVCDSDFFGSTDRQLMDKIHEDAPHFGLPDDTTEQPQPTIINPNQHIIQSPTHKIAFYTSSNPQQQRVESISGANSRGALRNLGRPSSFLRTSQRSAASMTRHSPKKPQSRANVPAAQVVRRNDDWTTRPELRLRVLGLPSDINTHALWLAFSRHGAVSQIEIVEDSKGRRDGAARITFSPPPSEPFWQRTQPFRVPWGAGNGIPVRFFLEPPRRTFYHPSPVNPSIKYPEVMTLQAGSIDFGIMYDRNTMMSMHTIRAGPQGGIRFKQSMLHRETVVEFGLDINSRSELFRFSIPFAYLDTVLRVDNGKSSNIELVVSLPTPPRFFRKLDEKDTHEPNARYWAENDAWFRQTDITDFPLRLKDAPITIKKPGPIIDIGRWTTYRLKFDISSSNAQYLFGQIGQALRDYNISIHEIAGFEIASHREPAVWKYIDQPNTPFHKPTSTLADLFKDESIPPLAFPVRYQLEVCISHGYLNEHNLSEEFIRRLRNMDPTKAQDILEYVASQEKRVFEPMELLDLKIIKGSASRPPIPPYCAFIRSATVTPSTVYFNTPTVEISNRVIRYYAEHADRFLRVRFTDEKVEGKIYSTGKDTMNEVFTRVKRALRNGIKVGERLYEFLAFGNSQFRENGAYFYAPLPHLQAQTIRNWMGDFDEIPYVAQHAARLGQCFSTTRAIIGTRTTIREIEDEERNGHVFTDGVGMLSPFLAQLITHELGILRTSPEPPSIFQFRMGGCKGILAVSPHSKLQEITIRRSQYKFAARHEGLEIIRWSQFAASNLNRQIIVVLSALGVPDEVFVEKQKHQLADLTLAMTNESKALTMLQKDIDPNQMTLTLAGMILDGFQRIQEPFMISMLRLWRAWSIKYLKEKARITIERGAFLLGCVDETATLKGHFNGSPVPEAHEPLEQRAKSLPQVFVQLSKGPKGKPEVILGPMLLARNPSLHPGDIRVVQGVDVVALRHLKDAVVVPQTGDRPIVNMCSGGDLDGDDYLVIWDPELLPREWNPPPMDFTPAEKIPLGRQVTPDDLTSFFVEYMKNDNLSRIAVAHLAFADFMEDGVKSSHCVKLAELHSTAVDYIKSGVPARMSRDLNPWKWPHFMEKKGRPRESIYQSRKVLGQLFDQVERVDFVPVFDAPFDQRILNAYQVESAMLEHAAVIKEQYDAAVRRIMAQHAISTEFEVWSTFVMSHSKASNDYKFHEEIGRIAMSLKDRFRAMCYEKAGGSNFETLGPFVVAMYTVTADQISQAVAEAQAMEGRMTTDKMPMISFPWLFHSVLGKIANGAGVA